MHARRIIDRIILTLVRGWCFVRYFHLCVRTYRRSRTFPDPATPVSHADKFLWRKIFDHNPLFTTACDKLAAKEYAQSTCPGLKTAEVLWVGSDADLIPDSVLAGSVVVKTNHGSRWNVMVQNATVDRAAMRERVSSWIRRRYGKSFGEWGYKDVPPRVFVERMLLEGGRPIASEYKFHVAAGRTAYVYMTRQDEFGRTRKCCLDRDGRVCPRQSDDDDDWEVRSPPASFEHMRRIAEELAVPFDYMRCDLYDLDGEIYFSELTAYPLSGQGGTNLYAGDLLNAQWDLRRSWFLTTPHAGWRGAYAAALGRWLDEAPKRVLRPGLRY